MQLCVFQKGFNFSQDGPGNRLVLHLQGCNMRCPWCANPEGMPLKPPLMQIARELPDWLCPRGAISGGALDRRVCADCDGRPCIHARRNKYLLVSAEVKPVEDWFEEILSASPLFFSGGGVTLTGGEVGVQLDAAIELCMLCKERGIHTAIESNLTRGDMHRIYPHLDLLIADYKHYDDTALRSATGAGNREIERNLILALESGLQVLARVTLVGGFNAGAGDIPGFARALGRIAQYAGEGQLSVELLRYHEYGADKWAQCGLTYRYQDGFVAAGRARAFRDALAAEGLNVVST